MQKKKSKVIPRSPARGDLELKPLNAKLYNDFSIEQLEKRLETKSWGCDSDCGNYWECPTNACDGHLAVQ